MSTKSKILDAAEYLFADKGFNGTSLREITSLAEVNLAAVNYHFGSKKELIKTAYLRTQRPDAEPSEGMAHQWDQGLPNNSVQT